MLRHDQEAAALMFPTLRRLVMSQLIPSWTFQPERRGDLVLLAGWRLWLVGGWSEAIAVLSDTDAKAYRCTAEGGEVWLCEGGLAEVVNGLIELPAPDQPTAPRLVKGRENRLWVPGMAG